MKRILHINSNKIWRGGEQQVDYLLNHPSQEFDKYLFCPENSALYNKNISVKKNKIFAFKKRFGFDIFAALQLKKVCKENQIDLIHLHDSHSINTYLLADLLGMNIPCIIHRRVNYPIKNKWKYQYKKILKIICLSKAVKKNLTSFIDETKLVVINPAIEIGRFTIHNNLSKINFLKQELHLPETTNIIGIIAALEREKNIDEFIEIANKLIKINNNYHFVIIGDGSLYNQLKTQHSKLNIHFLGFRNDIDKILPCFDLFLFTSKSEGFGQVLLEAMAAKVPVITNNFEVVNEIIQDKKTGFIYKNIEDAVQLIEQLLTTNDLQLTTIENAFNFVQQFDLSLMNKKVETVYRQLLVNNI